jgi:hypothetical protein
MSEIFASTISSLGRFLSQPEEIKKSHFKAMSILLMPSDLWSEVRDPWKQVFRKYSFYFEIQRSGFYDMFDIGRGRV